jgi:hypothetical protein
MPVRIPQGETEPLVDSGPGGTYQFRVLDADIRVARTRQQARNGRVLKAGDRGNFEVPPGEAIWAFAENMTHSRDARIEVEEQGFFIDLFPRSTVGSVQASDGSETAPASDAYESHFGKNIDVNASTETVTLEAPDRADFIVVNVDDAAGAYHVEVEYQDDQGNEITTVDGSTSQFSDLAGDGSTAVLTRVAIASPYLEVRIVDDSSAANALDYNLYAR